MKATTYAYRWFMWNIVSKGFIRFYLKRLYNAHLTPASEKLPKPPFVIVANHGTFFDPWLVGGRSPYPLSIMMNDDGFRGRGIAQWYVNGIGCFPKKKGAADVVALKKMIRFLSDKTPVFIFPEGQTTWDGETQLLYKGLEKIIQKVKCPLVTVRLQGNFLTKPWWAKSTRKGRILQTFKVLPAEKVCSMSSDELFTTLKDSIYQNDIKDPDNRAANFSGTNLAEGLERFVWVCLHCKCEDSLTTSGDRITCQKCGNSWIMDPWCRVKSEKGIEYAVEDLKDWSDFHKTYILEKLAGSSDTETLTGDTECTLYRENEERLFAPRENGNLSLTKEALLFKHPGGDMCFPVSSIFDYVVQKKDLLEFRFENEYYRFLFDGKSPMKWVFYLRYLKGYTECESRGYY